MWKYRFLYKQILGAGKTLVEDIFRNASLNYIFIAAFRIFLFLIMLFVVGHRLGKQKDRTANKGIVLSDFDTDSSNFIWKYYCPALDSGER